MSKADVAAERKDQIVRATVECITKHGYHNFSMQDVARTAGVSKGIIHYYFLNKDELMMSVLDKVAGDIERVLVSEMEASPDPIRKLEIFVDVCFDVVRSTKEYYQVNMDFWTQINQKLEVRTVIARHYNQFRETAIKVIDEGKSKGSFKDVNAHQYASYMIAVIDGLSLQILFDESAFEYEAMVKKAGRLLLEGLKK
jgi:TetR/AcrR family transcriptional regulator, fatty acid metabolism regulator protein